MSMHKTSLEITSGIILMTVFLLSACGDISPTDNRNIDGYWLLVNIDSISNGHIENGSQEKRFWAIEGKLFQTGGLTLMTEKRGDTLRLYRPAADSASVNSKNPSIDPYRKYGLNSFDEHFIIEQLTHEHLTVRDSLLRIQFRRY